MTPILPTQWTQTDSPEKWTKPRKQDERTQSVLQADASYINVLPNKSFVVANNNDICPNFQINSTCLCIF